MRIQQLPSAGGGTFVGPSFAEVLEAATFVRPYWTKLYGLRQQLTQLRRTSAGEWASARARANLVSQLDALEHNASSLLRQFEARAPERDRTGKVGLLKEAIQDFLFRCSERPD